MDGFRFRVIQKDKITKARIGEIHTSHGVIQTPAFVPVGTQATVKSLSPDELKTLGVDLFFVNTYHTYLRPGIDVIKRFGGLHRFMHWDRPIITDSGGFQVFSLGRNKFKKSVGRETLDEASVLQDDTSSQSLVKISENGVAFQSHWDGTRHVFTPESSMEHQWNLGSDIHIAFDDCTPYPVTYEHAKASMERTHRWAERSLIASGKCKVQSAKLGKPYQALYGVVQGSVYEDLRQESARTIAGMDFDGIAIGGVSVGESKKEMINVLDWTIPLLPDNKPRHLLGVGEIDDIFELVERGIDTFDCVQPTRLARMGRVYSSKLKVQSAKFEIDITKNQYSEDTKSIEEGCACYTCRNFSRAYLHHLFRVRELLGYRLATIHNIHVVNVLVKNIREAIGDGSLLDLKRKWLYH